VQDRLWFFVSGRNNAYNNYVANAFNPDGTRAVDDNIVKSFPGRITGQATKNDRFTLLFDWANKVRGHRGLSATVSPEASDRQTQPASHIAQVKWTRTQSSKMLIEGGYTNTYIGSLFKYQPDIPLATCRSAFAACPAGTNYGNIAKQDLILGTRWSASMPTAVATAPAHQPGTSHVIIGSVSYVSGAHNIKVGIQNRSGWLKDLRRDINGDIVQQYRNGVPAQVLVLNTPLNNTVNLNADFGFFAQDTWTMRRLTLNPGVRFDYFNSEVPAMSAPAGRFVPERTFEAIKDTPNWKNVSPRFGAAYDLFGNGKTAIKGNIGLYLQSEGTGFANTYNPQIFSTDTRTWNDLNRDDIAQENELGPTSNLTFGVRRNQNADPDIARPYQLLGDIGIQHELRPGLAVAIGYNRRSYEELVWTDNLATTHADYTLLTTPDPRGNGELLPVYNLDRAKLGPIVFADPAARRDLESIVHPAVYRAIAAGVRAFEILGNDPFVVVDVPLLYETGAEKDFDRVIVTACLPATQLARLRQRGLSEEDAQRRLAAQWPTDDKAARADFVVTTDGGFEETNAQVDGIYRKLREL